MGIVVRALNVCTTLGIVVRALNVYTPLGIHHLAGV